ncbi:MAG: Rrf2 family transcriptional regulator [Chloroflexi bacterium]|nr:Rrf2 family transcriptional regulator [Chloroflexota bacterium]
MLSRRADYGVRAMLDVALQSPTNRLVVAEIAERQSIPAHFLAKIVPRLARAGLLQTSLGASGGVTLAVPADQITLLQIIEAIDGPLTLNLCSIDPIQCHQSKDCVLLDVWCNAQTKLNETLAQTRLVDLVAHQRRVASENKS